MKLWIDDVRPPPDDTWTWCTTGDLALAHLAHSYLSTNTANQIEMVSFDHDLGGDNTSIFVAQMIELMAHGGHKPPAWQIHSANPVGRMNLEAALMSADRLWAKEDKLG